MVIFHSYVKLPEGISYVDGIRYSTGSSTGRHLLRLKKTIHGLLAAGKSIGNP